MNTGAKKLGAQAQASQTAAGRPANFIAGGEGLLNHLELIIGFGLQLQDHAALADRCGLQNYVVLAATMNVRDRVTRAQCLDRHKFNGFCM
jgi:hypothetical protein